MLALAFWCFIGMVIDGWAHTHGEVDDSFFTKWHGIWYSGFTAYALYVIFGLGNYTMAIFQKSVCN